DVFADVDIGDIDGKDFEGRAGVEAALKHGARDHVRILKYFLVRGRRTDGRHNTFADARDDRFLGRTADEAVDVGAHGHAGACFDLNAVHGDRGDGGLAGARVRAVDHLRIDGSLHGIEDVAAG